MQSTPGPLLNMSVSRGKLLTIRRRVQRKARRRRRCEDNLIKERQITERPVVSTKGIYEFLCAPVYS